MTSNNNIPQGYKQTDLGIIPEDWDTIKICEGLADVKSGKRLPYGYYVTDNRTKHPYIRVIDMYDGGIDTSNLMYVPKEAYKSIEKYRIFKDDIFISVAGTLGIVGKIPSWLDGANLTENANRLTNITCCRDYLLYYLRSPYIQDVISSEQTVGAQPKLALNRIRNFEIALPSSDTEQKAIATVLSDVDALIAALDKKIAKKKLIKQGAMQQLLTGKKRLPGFTEEWVQVKLGDLTTMNSGGTPSSSVAEYYNGNIPFLSISDITTAGKYINKTEKCITEKGLQNSSARMYPIGTIMYAMYASLGKTSISNIELSCSQAILGIQPNHKLDSHYLYYHLSFIENEVKDMGQTGTQSNLSKQIVQNFILYIPTNIKEQQAIATILSDMDKEISDLETKRDKYRLIKQGMMQKLLTGQIRLRY